jgi:hypothetical protein
MAKHAHVHTCPNCNHTWFREEKIVQLDASVLIRASLPVEGRTTNVTYRYVCANCNQVLDEPWQGHQE